MSASSLGWLDGQLLANPQHHTLEEELLVTLRVFVMCLQVGVLVKEVEDRATSASLQVQAPTGREVVNSIEEKHQLNFIHLEV